MIWPGSPGPQRFVILLECMQMIENTFRIYIQQADLCPQAEMWDTVRCDVL